MKLIDVPFGFRPFRCPDANYWFNRRTFKPGVVQHIFCYSQVSVSGILESYSGWSKFVNYRGCDEWVSVNYRHRVMGTKEEFWGFGHGAD